MMRDLVTGASGFVGSHLARALLANGHEVRVLVRRADDGGALKKLGARVIIGDITIPFSLPAALAGVQRVFHCAAMVSDWGTRAQFHRTNVRGVENVLAEACEAGVQRFIHLSSTDVYGFPQCPGDEQMPMTRRGWPYGDTKIAGEEAVWTCHRERGLPVTVMRPANVYGVGSRSFVLEIAEQLKRRHMIHLGRGTNAAGLCSVDNLVACILLAVENKGSVGQAYNVTDDTLMAWREFVELLARHTGLPSPRFTIPRGPAYALGWLLEKMGDPARQTRRPLLTRMAVEIFTANQAFSIAKARRELGYRPSGSIGDTMVQMAAWLSAEGVC